MTKANYIQELIADLIARLPELEWKISSLNPFLLSQSISKNLFRSQDLTAAACIKELKVDIHVLSTQNNERSAQYLAVQVKQKISVLVGLCKVQQKKKNENKKANFGMVMLSTRQQWLHSLEHDVEVLIKQQEALAKRSAQMQFNNTVPSVLLNLKAELGEVEKKLTLAKEALNKAFQNAAYNNK